MIAINKIDEQIFYNAESKNNFKRNSDENSSRLALNKIGPGLRNYGNTCFLNSVLQCLTYSSPLYNYLIEK